MNPSDFLFPRDLEVTPTGLKSILMIGSCLLSGFRDALLRDTGLAAEHIVFNNAGDLPPRSEAEIAGHDCQYIQLPLRTILSDAVIRPDCLDAPGGRARLVAQIEASLHAMLDAALGYYREHGILTIVANFVVPQRPIVASLKSVGGAGDMATLVRHANDVLADLVRPLPNVFLADADALGGSMGKRYFLDDAIYFHSHNATFFDDWSAFENHPVYCSPEPGRIEPVPPVESFYPNQTPAFFAATLRQIEWIVRVSRQLDPVKLVVFDLDNTLWRGQIGDHYVPGRNWPQAHGWPVGLWEAIHHLRWRGILTAICSRNDADLVARRWSSAVDPPLVALADFTVARINWESKAGNIAEILAETGLTPKGVVFVDDNPIERESVRNAFPAIRTIGANPFVTRRILLWSAETNVATLSDESRLRDQMVRGQISREAERASTPASREDFLRSLETVVTMHAVAGDADQQFGRALELLNKTNQFNTTGRRWTYPRLLVHLRRGGRMLTFAVRDRFADYGTVGVVLVSSGQIVQFVMSCRVLGMGVETAILSRVTAEQRADGDGDLTASIVETEFNIPCRDLYARNGFVPEEDGEWRLRAGTSIAVPDHVAFGRPGPAAS